MNRSQARAFVSDTFTHGFDKASFRAFVQNLLNHFDESKAAQWNQQYVKDAFKDHVQKFERLGTYTSPNRETLDVLIVYLTTDSKLERARTSIRNFVADHLKQRDEKDAALVAFVSPSESSWRFSYIRMEYATVQADSGKVGVEARLTPARRFSYIVGEGESCHTAQSRFLNLLGNDSTDPALAQIEEAFSVEAVTKEFFEKYAELFGDIHAALEKLAGKNKAIRDEFASKGIQTVDFAKKLMGQIVFLYFLQKKGWLGVERGKAWGTGPHDLLRRMASGAYGEYKNFFNDILEPLFYDTLASDRGHEAWCDRFKCRIPFLNGGLFEPLGDYDWRSIDIPLPNELFTNAKHIEEGVTGSGVLDVFDRYNFTVNEAEPLEQEVAIDPEMLGKVFENLIEENRRKGLGAFYTPREIVHYMCQQSLVHYLHSSLNKTNAGVSNEDVETFVSLGEQISHYEAVDTSYPIKMPKSIQVHARLIDEKLAAITVCDPAVGSGAFPVGMMTEIVRCRSALTPYFNDPNERNPYHFKRHAIQHCLYGVDIDAGAVEIAKLRLWLSLIVDEQERKQIKPLPNLDFKIVGGNSLLGFPYKSHGLTVVENLKLRFFEETDHSRKSALKREIESTLLQCFSTSKKDLGYTVNFDFRINFSEVFERQGGFDVVIGNPPYVRQEKIMELKPALKQHYQCYTGAADLYVYFFERGIELLNQGGVFSFITSNKWMRSGYGGKLRDFLKSHTSVYRLLDFGDAKIFEAIAYPCIAILEKGNPAAGNGFKALRWDQEYWKVEELTRHIAEDMIWMAQADLDTDAWRIEAKGKLELMKRISKAGRPLGDLISNGLFRGLTTGLNEAFVVNRETHDRLIAEHPSSRKVLKPYLRGKDIERWNVDFGEQYLLFVPWHFPLHDDTSINGASEIAEKQFQAHYPAIYKHLLSFKNELSQRNTTETGVRYEWYALQRWGSEYWKEFEKQKIVSTKVSIRPTFALETQSSYLGNTSYFFPTDDGIYLLAFLNSSVAEYYSRSIFVEKQNGFYEVQPDALKKMPIPQASSTRRVIIETISKRVITLGSHNSQTAYYERLLNALVYELFFEEELYALNLYFFDLISAAGMPGTDAPSEWEAFHRRIADVNHPIYAALFALNGVEVVRMIEGRE